MALTLTNHKGKLIARKTTQTRFDSKSAVIEFEPGIPDGEYILRSTLEKAKIRYIPAYYGGGEELCEEARQGKFIPAVYAASECGIKSTTARRFGQRSHWAMQGRHSIAACRCKISTRFREWRSRSRSSRKKAAAEYIEDCSVSEEYRHLFIQLQRSGSKNTLHSGGRTASERKSVSET